jgi:tRNA U34 5-methylaminomethyl-2-thiouridine-forming methyltransferase MnmC
MMDANRDQAPGGLEIRVTGDGSHTLFVPSLNEHYHSTFGAVTESDHIFIKAGLASLPAGMEMVSILEIGFGTGLNAFLACLYAQQNHLMLYYTALEKYPLPDGMEKSLNFSIEMTSRFEAHAESRSLIINDLFFSLHQICWKKWHEITPFFRLLKIEEDLLAFQPAAENFDLVFFDAFGPDVQPEMWTEEVFRKIAVGMRPGGILVTYSTKGVVKRNLKAAGFSIEKLPGPPGKREILRARIPFIDET